MFWQELVNYCNEISWLEFWDDVDELIEDIENDEVRFSNFRPITVERFLKRPLLYIIATIFWFLGMIGEIMRTLA